ncbi:hypothetical protein [Roseibium salinum]|uniref:Uncharacterized protein n=1 Tax=Roseibium salinum TaxID=1604349 RepID=A0ABT3R1Q8_9HYPH|nr:hypothetical protein [Roseibium sp. DSM 29163]MCX2723085.1 hypothetical protein [Roseibium sp. DSM 29163]
MTREETIIRKARQICAWRIRTFLRSVCAVVAGGLGLAALSGTPAGTQEPVSLQNHILAIGSCPPWHPQSVEICRHSLQEVVSSLAPRVNAGPDKTHLLINEGASAAALKRKATELANKLTPNDRLIIYANLPLGASDITLPSGQTGYVLELWSGQKPETTNIAISEGTWMTAPAFAAMIHTFRAAEVILILDANNSNAANLHLLDQHDTDLKGRPEAIVSSSGAGQTANYSADRTISLFAKHLALALTETEGSLREAMTAAVNGTRQAAIPICADLKTHTTENNVVDCQQEPAVYDPDHLLSRTLLIPVSETRLN